MRMFDQVFDSHPAQCPPDDKKHDERSRHDDALPTTHGWWVLTKGGHKERPSRISEGRPSPSTMKHYSVRSKLD